MRKFYTFFILFISLFFTVNVFAYSEENIEKNRLEFEKILNSKYNFSKISDNKLIRVDEKINTIIEKVSSGEVKFSSYEGEKFLGKVIALSDFINYTLNSKGFLQVNVIYDKRCLSCDTDLLINDLKGLSYSRSTRIVEKEFSTIGVKKYLEKNKIKKLPAVIFSSNDIDGSDNIKKYLRKLPNEHYSLNIGSTFDPFRNRSERGFSILNKETLEKIKSYSYLKGDKNAEISWLEYSDIQCPFCARLHNSDVLSKIKETYGNKVNKYYIHYPLEFHKNAFSGALVLECIAEQKGADGFYNLLNKAYKNNKSDLDYLYSESKNLGANEKELKNCVESSKYKKKIEEGQKLGLDIFNITGTPGSVIVNNKTGEYEIIPGAYPFEKFKNIIDLIKD